MWFGGLGRDHKYEILYNVYLWSVLFYSNSQLLFLSLGVITFQTALFLVPTHDVGIRADWSITPRNARRILFLPRFCVFIGQKMSFMFYRPMLYVVENCQQDFIFMWWSKCWLQCNGHRIMTPSGFELVCCKPYFALLSATGLKSPRKMETGCRPCQTDAILSAFMPPLESKLMNKPLLLVIFWGKRFVLLCVCACAPTLKHN